MLKHEAAAYLAGLTSEDSSNTVDPTNVHVISGEVSGTSEDGKVLVSIDGMMFSEDDDQYVEVDALGGLEDGDIVTILLTGESGHGMTPFALGTTGTVDRVKATAVNAANSAQAAQDTANAAQAVAEATDQHFFSDENGIHVTEETQEDWNTDHTGANVLINSAGQLFRDGLNNLLTLTTENNAKAIAIWDGVGNISSLFSADETHLGMTNGSGKVYLANDYVLIRGKGQETETGVREVFGNISSASEYDGPNEDPEHWSSTKYSGVAFSGMETYAGVPIGSGSGESRVIISAKSMDWKGTSPQKNLDPSVLYSDFDPYTGFTDYNDARIELLCDGADEEVDTSQITIKAKDIWLNGAPWTEYQMRVSGVNEVSLRANTVGNIGLYDITNDEWILYKNNSGNTVYRGLSKNFSITSAAILNGNSISSGGLLTGETDNLGSTGFYPLGIIGWRSNSRYTVFRDLYLSSRSDELARITWGITNIHSSAITPTVYAYILWVRT